MDTDLLPMQHKAYEQVVIEFRETIDMKWLVNTKLDYVTETAGQLLAFRLTKFCLGGELEELVYEIPYYADWWEAVKDRFAPRWFRRRWPVHWKFHHIPQRITRVCPHANIEFRPGERQHFTFLDAMPVASFYKSRSILRKRE